MNVLWLIEYKATTDSDWRLCSGTTTDFYYIADEEEARGELSYWQENSAGQYEYRLVKYVADLS